MSDTAIRANKPSPLPPAIPEKAPRPKPHPVYRALTGIASLRLTVVLFAMAVFLVFAGTLAQIDEGVGSVVANYFRCAVAWIPLQLFVQFGQIFFNLPKEWLIPRNYAFPYPGGWLIGTVMLVNLLAAHSIRFKLTWKRPGVVILHAGVVVLMIGEIFAKYQVEGFMRIEEGETASVVDDNRRVEAVVIDAADPKFDNIVAVPEGLLRRKQPIADERLPVSFEVLRYLDNSDLVSLDKAGPDFKNLADKGAGVATAAIEMKEVSGTAQKQTVDVPSAYVAFKDKNGKALGTYLLSALLKPQSLDVDGKTYQVALRFKRIYLPFKLQLHEFRFDRYVGTNTPKNFSSRVQLVDSELNEDREVVIRMNEPLRYRGQTFFQADWNKDTERGTVLQVVDNPGWRLPYIACIVVALGMLIHFGMHLITFLGRRTAV